MQQALGFVDVPGDFDSRRLHHYLVVVLDGCARCSKRRSELLRAPLRFATSPEHSVAAIDAERDFVCVTRLSIMSGSARA
ncbi:MAG: hypothetical protein KF773_14120 [Deltaproteobacteria bacterium]|nr:hypothetical protein [Deltaproteobacteria bacterium]